MLSITNPERGCGKMKEGGFYLKGNRSPLGDLASWTWVLGAQTKGSEHNVFIRVPPRNMVVGAFPYSLLTGAFQELEPQSTSYEGTGLANLDRLAIFDHIGKQHYTPMSFKYEVVEHGPSRRVPENVARIVATRVPIPIVFTHVDIPYLPESEDFPTWANVEWGMLSDNDHGNEHYLIQHFDTDFSVTESTFGASWITDVNYVVKGDETDDFLSGLEESNVIPVTLEVEECPECGSENLSESPRMTWFFHPESEDLFQHLVRHHSCLNCEHEWDDYDLPPEVGFVGDDEEKERHFGL